MISQVIVNETNTQFIEHIIFIMKNVLEQHTPPGLFTCRLIPFTCYLFDSRKAIEGKFCDLCLRIGVSLDQDKKGAKCKASEQLDPQTRILDTPPSNR